MVVLGTFLLIVGIYPDGDGVIVIGATFMIVGAVGAFFGTLVIATVYESDYNSAVETAITLEGYSNVSYDGESTFTAASPSGEYFSGYLAPMGDDTFKIVEIPS